MREYPPNEEEYPQPTWCAGTTHFAACVSAHFLIHQTSFAKVVNVHHPGLGASETRQVPTEQTKKHQKPQAWKQESKRCDHLSTLAFQMEYNRKAKMRNERKECIYEKERKTVINIYTSTTYTSMRGMHIYEGFVHLQGPCARKIKPRFDQEREKGKGKKEKRPNGHQAGKKLVKNIN